MPEMPASHAIFLQSFETDVMHYEKNLKPKENIIRSDSLLERKEITEQKVVHADIINNYNQIKHQRIQQMVMMMLIKKRF